MLADNAIVVIRLTQLTNLLNDLKFSHIAGTVRPLNSISQPGENVYILINI